MMRYLLCLLVVSSSLLLHGSLAAEPYAATRAKIGVQDAVIRAHAALSAQTAKSLEEHVRSNVELLFDAWRGTAWGLGAPQTDTPGVGKINCGTFVGTVLVHAGFVVNHKKLQRQPSELIIKSLANKHDIRRFRNKPMEVFLEGVRSMGPGLFIIGLDYHVGFLVVEPDGRVRFVHAGVYPSKVVDEPAAGAREITESRYRVVGKILADDLLNAWLERRRIVVKGGW